MSELLRRFSIEDPFWSQYETLVTKEVIPYQEKALMDLIPEAERSGAIENFRMAAQMLEEGKCDKPFYGMVFQDSDVAKWIEAAAYSLVSTPDAALEQRIDELIELIGRAQHKDGYLNTYFTVKRPDDRWSNLHEAHELYCAGHMIEAAVAYYEATGKENLLNIMKRMADHIYDRFITHKVAGYPGHPEIELALMRLYRATGEKKYEELAEHFINVRGVDPDYFAKEKEKRDWTVWGADGKDKAYAQNQGPIRELTEVTGHAVRAVYLLTGAADLAATTKDETLASACKRLWKNMVSKRMYITGGIGSTALGEAFTKDYNLPNDTAYAETCASIGLIFFARKMLDLEVKGEYADVMEQALYNCVLAGMQLDGKRFFYVNPLEVIPGISGEAVTHRHTLPQRPKWFGCACCPPNVARMLTSIAEYAWKESEDTLYSNLYIGGTLDLTQTKGVKLQVETNYPYEGNVCYKIEPAKEASAFTLALRIPNWCKNASVMLNGEKIYSKEDLHHTTHANCSEMTLKVEEGYLYITRAFKAADEITMQFDMTPTRVYASPKVAADSCKVALMRGPLVYCVEGVDNEEDVLGLAIQKEGKISVGEWNSSLLGGIRTLSVPGVRYKANEALYSNEPFAKEEVCITAVPYYTWGNRGLNEMRVWLPQV